MERNEIYSAKFDLEDFSLSSFFSEVAIYLDLHANEQTKKLEEKNYDAIAHASKILREKSRKFRMQEGNLTEIRFFWEFYGEKKDESDKNISRELSADRLAILSEELATAKNLPQKRIEKLVDTCSKLSQKTGEYWNIKNPTGFKRYANQH